MQTGTGRRSGKRKKVKKITLTEKIRKWRPATLAKLNKSAGCPALTAGGGLAGSFRGPDGGHVRHLRLINSFISDEGGERGAPAARRPCSLRHQPTTLS